MGVYLAEICMIGLFALANPTALGPLVMMFGLLIFTALIHVSLNAALSPLLFNLPRTLAVEEELRRAGQDGLDFAEDKHEDLEDPDHINPYDDDFDPSAPTQVNDRGIEGGEQLLKITTTGLTSYMRIKYRKSPIPMVIGKLDFWSYWITPDPTIEKPNFLLKWLHPEVFADYALLRKTVPDFPEIIYDDGIIKDAFNPPSVRSRPPRLWIPKDAAGVSVQEVAHSGKVIQISDEGSWIDKKGRIIVDKETDRRETWEKMRY